MNHRMPKWLLLLWLVALIGIVTYVVVNMRSIPAP